MQKINKCVIGGVIGIAVLGGLVFSVRNAKLVDPNKAAYDKLTQALLNDRLQIEAKREEGGRHGCEPQEPYYKLSVKRHGAERYMEDLTGPAEARRTLKETDIADGIIMIESTGEVEIMDVCLE